MELKISSESEFFRIHDKLSVDLLNPSAGAFLGAFMSEGNLTDNLNLKITCKDLNFINSATQFIREVLGNYAATESPPTNEHISGDDGFHKYYSKHASRLLTEGY